MNNRPNNDAAEVKHSAQSEESSTRSHTHYVSNNNQILPLPDVAQQLTIDYLGIEDLQAFSLKNARQKLQSEDQFCMNIDRAAMKQYSAYTRDESPADLINFWMQQRLAQNIALINTLIDSLADIPESSIRLIQAIQLASPNSADEFLKRAMQKNNMQMVRYLSGIAPFRDIDADHALDYIYQQRDLISFSRFLNNPSSAYQQNKDEVYDRMLKIAAIQGIHDFVVEILTQRPELLNSRGQRQVTALCCAIQNDQHTVINTLLSYPLIDLISAIQRE